MTFGERLAELRKSYGYMTRNQLAEELRIPVTTLRNYETGTREPSHSFIKEISKFFNISANYLLCLTDEKETLGEIRLTQKEKNIIENYRFLNDDLKEVVERFLVIEVEREKDLEAMREAQKKRLSTYEKALREMYNKCEEQETINLDIIENGIQEKTIR